MKKYIILLMISMCVNSWASNKQKTKQDLLDNNISSLNNTIFQQAQTIASLTHYLEFLMHKTICQDINNTLLLQTLEQYVIDRKSILALLTCTYDSVGTCLECYTDNTSANTNNNDPHNNNKNKDLPACKIVHASILSILQSPRQNHTASFAGTPYTNNNINTNSNNTHQNQNVNNSFSNLQKDQS